MCIAGMTMLKSRAELERPLVELVAYPLTAPRVLGSSKKLSCPEGGDRGLQVASCGLREMVRLQVAGRLGRLLQVVGFTVARDRSGFREELLDAPCSRLSIVRFDTGPKRSMGHLLGGEKNNFFNSRY